jgi:hypothetical protein
VKKQTKLDLGYAATRYALVEAGSLSLPFSRRVRVVTRKRFPDLAVTRRPHVAYMHARCFSDRDSFVLATRTLILMANDLGHEYQQYPDRWWDCLNRLKMTQSDGTAGHGWYLLLRDYEPGPVSKPPREPKPRTKRRRAHTVDMRGYGLTTEQIQYLRSQGVSMIV